MGFRRAVLRAAFSDRLEWSPIKGGNANNAAQSLKQVRDGSGYYSNQHGDLYVRPSQLGLALIFLTSWIRYVDRVMQLAFPGRSRENGLND
jgi:hypothetical protein